MKSSEAHLRLRGKYAIDDLQLYKDCSETELLELIHSERAYERTISVKLLSEKVDLNDDIIHLYLQTLKHETKLYTKIELCSALSKGKRKSAIQMIEYLGKIGNNQHHLLPDKGFNKKSYPLPRDIISRTLAHMDQEVLPVLLEVLKTDNIIAIREVIDAIGFMCFYGNRQTNSSTSYVLLRCLHAYSHDDLIRWKLVRAFSSFNSVTIIETLTKIKHYDKQAIIRIEAERSLKIIRCQTN